MELGTHRLLDLTHTAAAPLLAGTEYPWQALPGIGEFILELGAALSGDEYEEIEEQVWLHKTVKRFPGNFIAGPCIIGPETEVRPGAFIRGNALVGAGCVVGNSTELKNVILFDGVQVPHYNYVGDSILGYRSHMGAGSITSNVKSDKTLVEIRCGEDKVKTGLKKMGAVLGSFVEVGCGSILNPGTVIGSHTNVYPLSSVRGYVPGASIYKRQGEVVEKR